MFEQKVAIKNSRLCISGLAAICLTCFEMELMGTNRPSWGPINETISNPNGHGDLRRRVNALYTHRNMIVHAFNEPLACYPAETCSLQLDPRLDLDSSEGNDPVLSRWTCWDVVPEPFKKVYARLNFAIKTWYDRSEADLIPVFVCDTHVDAILLLRQYATEHETVGELQEWLKDAIFLDHELPVEPEYDWDTETLEELENDFSHFM
jgi:hypothetical protein